MKVEQSVWLIITDRPPKIEGLHCESLSYLEADEEAHMASSYCVWGDPDTVEKAKVSCPRHLGWRIKYNPDTIRESGDKDYSIKDMELDEDGNVLDMGGETPVLDSFVAEEGKVSSCRILYIEVGEEEIVYALYTK